MPVAGTATALLACGGDDEEPPQTASTGSAELLGTYPLTLKASDLRRIRLPS
jgi:hypothetical protein